MLTTCRRSRSIGRASRAGDGDAVGRVGDDCHAEAAIDVGHHSAMDDERVSSPPHLVFYVIQKSINV